METWPSAKLCLSLLLYQHFFSPSALKVLFRVGNIYLRFRNIKYSNYPSNNIDNDTHIVQLCCRYIFNVLHVLNINTFLNALHRLTYSALMTILMLGPMNMSIAQMRTLKLKEVNRSAQGYRAFWGWVHNHRPGLPAPKSGLPQASPRTVHDDFPVSTINLNESERTVGKKKVWIHFPFALIYCILPTKF